MLALAYHLPGQACASMTERVSILKADYVVVLANARIQSKIIYWMLVATSMTGSAEVIHVVIPVNGSIKSKPIIYWMLACASMTGRQGGAAGFYMRTYLRCHTGECQYPDR